mgnify:CR=1 FL=1
MAGLPRTSGDEPWTENLNVIPVTPPPHERG